MLEVAAKSGKGSVRKSGKEHKSKASVAKPKG